MLESGVSFAPLRANCPCIPFICARDYFACAARAILDARQQILIAGWWLDVDIPLVRPESCSDPRAIQAATDTRALGVSCGCSAQAYPNSCSMASQSNSTGSGSASGSKLPAETNASSLPPLTVRNLLRLKAEQGVRIYVMLYKELKQLHMTNASKEAKDTLVQLHPNIRVLRHPNQIVGSMATTGHALAQSHHEKLLIID